MKTMKNLEDMKLMNDLEVKLDQLKAEYAKEKSLKMGWEIGKVKDKINTLKMKNVDVGDGITVICDYPLIGRDIYTVIKRTKTTITLQQDRVVWVHIPYWNHESTADYIRDKNGAIVTYKWSKKHNCWEHDYWRPSMILGRHI